MCFIDLHESTAAQQKRNEDDADLFLIPQSERHPLVSRTPARFHSIARTSNATFSTRSHITISPFLLARSCQNVHFSLLWFINHSSVNPIVILVPTAYQQVTQPGCQRSNAFFATFLYRYSSGWRRNGCGRRGCTSRRGRRCAQAALKARGGREGGVAPNRQGYVWMGLVCDGGRVWAGMCGERG